MIDFEMIGKRILEERKYLHRISQEKMALDLGMYQADISNLEKAKKGSGISDLYKLDLIADYFEIPLESLIFGRRQDKMEKYYGTKMLLKPFTGKLSAKHRALLRNLMGTGSKENTDAAPENVSAYKCGPYMIYEAHEFQFELSGSEPSENKNYLEKIHLYVIYQDEVIGCLTACVTTLMQHVFQPALEKLKTFIMPDIFELEDTLHVLNPYMLMYHNAITAEEEERYKDLMYQRMDELRKAGENRTIFYVENAYVREDCRRNGIARMMTDVLKKADNGCIIRCSLEPTSGDELSSEYAYFPSYEAADIGQINLNASIAELLGFMIDEKTVERQSRRVEEDGSVVTETVPIRRNAYLLPKQIRNLLKQDGDLTSQGRAREKTLGNEKEKPKTIDVYNGAWSKFGFIVSIKMVYSDETVFAFARGMDWEHRFLGVSKENPAPTGKFVETSEKYDRLEEAVDSRHYHGLRVAEQLLGALYFETVKPEDVNFDALQ